MAVWFVIANNVEMSINNGLNEYTMEWSYRIALCSCENEEGLAPQIYAVMPSLYHTVITKAR